ncbi:DUF2905 domain-containing protein [bacterium]|nr:DUF2905 domain-containing protein [candidate division CSSED10-310 bacterium]
MKPIALVLIVTGVLIILAGVGLYFSDKMHFISRMPGDLHIKTKSGSFHFPIVTCLIISILLTLIINIVMMFFRK